MKKTGLLLFFMALLLVWGCGQKADEGQKDSNETMAQEVPKDDTLATKTFEIRNEDDPFVTIQTKYGDMILELYRDVAPAHADSFVARTNDGFYNGLLFFRIINNFMIQGGDPNNNGSGNAGYFLNAEFNDLPHQDGTLSMARAQAPNSASSQFFICLARNRQTQFLDGKYTVFGQLIKGYDVLHKIGAVEVEANPNNPREISKPLEEIAMDKVFLSDADGNPL